MVAPSEWHTYTQVINAVSEGKLHKCGAGVHSSRTDGSWMCVCVHTRNVEMRDDRRICFLSNHSYWQDVLALKPFIQRPSRKFILKKKSISDACIHTYTREHARTYLWRYMRTYIYIYITMITRRTCLPFLVAVRKTFQRFSVDGNPFCKIRFCSLRRLLSLIKDISGSTRLLLDLLRRKECVVVIVSINREITHNNNNKGGERPSESPRNARPDVQS